MTDATRSPAPGRELAAPGRDGEAVPRLDASVPVPRREAHARGQAATRPDSGRERPGRAGSRSRTREIVGSTISAVGEALGGLALCAQPLEVRVHEQVDEALEVDRRRPAEVVAGLRRVPDEVVELRLPA